MQLTNSISTALGAVTCAVLLPQPSLPCKLHVSCLLSCNTVERCDIHSTSRAFELHLGPAASTGGIRIEGLRRRELLTSCSPAGKCITAVITSGQRSLLLAVMAACMLTPVILAWRCSGYRLCCQCGTVHFLDAPSTQIMAWQVGFICCWLFPSINEHS